MLKTVLWVFFWTEASLLSLQTAFSRRNEAPLCVLMRGDGNRAHVWVFSMDISVLSLFGSSWDVPALLRDIYSGDVLLIGVWAEPRGGDVTRWVWRKGWVWITCLKRFNVNWKVGMRKWCVASRWKRKNFCAWVARGSRSLKLNWVIFVLYFSTPMCSEVCFFTPDCLFECLPQLVLFDCKKWLHFLFFVFFAFPSLFFADFHVDLHYIRADNHLILPWKQKKKYFIMYQRNIKGPNCCSCTYSLFFFVSTVLMIHPTKSSMWNNYSNGMLMTF